MTRARKTRITACAVVVLLTGGMTIAQAQLTVFDPSNYQQNLLAAARALEQINNQVRTLQNQVQAIQRMDQNLVRLGSTLAPDLQRTLADIQAQLRAGDGLALDLQQTEIAYQQLYQNKRRQRCLPTTFCATHKPVGTKPTQPSSAPPLCKVRSSMASKPIQTCSSTPCSGHAVLSARWKLPKPATS